MPSDVSVSGRADSDSSGSSRNSVSVFDDAAFQELAERSGGFLLWQVPRRVNLVFTHFRSRCCWSI